MKNISKLKLSPLAIGLLLANMLLPLEACASDTSNFLRDKTMSNIQKQADQKASIAVNIEQHANKRAAQVQVKQPETSYEAPYPFTADELWEKLLKVVELPDGYITKERVESIFGVTLKLDEESQKKYQKKVYYLKRGENWYFDLGVSEYSETETDFYFGWGNTPGERPGLFPPPPPSMCINAFKIMPSIAQRGWNLKFESRMVHDIPNSNDYRKGKMGVLQIGFFPHDNCLVEIKIFATKNADQLVR